MIKCDRGRLEVKGVSTEVAAEGVEILALLYKKGILAACLKTFEDMLYDGTIDKVLKEVNLID